jgi:hypothetical protein
MGEVTGLGPEKIERVGCFKRRRLCAENTHRAWLWAGVEWSQLHSGWSVARCYIKPSQDQGRATIGNGRTCGSWDDINLVTCKVRGSGNKKRCSGGAGTDQQSYVQGYRHDVVLYANKVSTCHRRQRCRSMSTTPETASSREPSTPGDACHNEANYGWCVVI